MTTAHTHHSITFYIFIIWWKTTEINETQCLRPANLPTPPFSHYPNYLRAPLSHAVNSYETAPEYANELFSFSDSGRLTEEIFNKIEINFDRNRRQQQRRINVAVDSTLNIEFIAWRFAVLTLKVELKDIWSFHRRTRRMLSHMYFILILFCYSLMKVHDTMKQIIITGLTCDPCAAKHTHTHITYHASMQMNAS